jgi:hypothetical protein
MPERETVVQVIANEIERYLMRNPSAADSVDGIHLWWLSERLREEPVAYVQAALDRLVARAAMTEIPLKGGRVIYARR